MYRSIANQVEGRLCGRYAGPCRSFEGDRKAPHHRTAYLQVLQVERSRIGLTLAVRLCPAFVQLRIANDGLIGVNTGGNHWNQAKPDGQQKCVHAFIGKLADGTVATYQTLPWNMRGIGHYAGGAANNTHIGFEICEDDLTNANYFNAVYQEAVELCAYLEYL